MLITLTRRRLGAVLDSLANGHCITAPEHGQEWEDSEILAVAGACMSELMFRREVEHDEIADDPLRFHAGRNYGQLSARLTTALNYALGVASNLTCGRVSVRQTAPDKTYKVEVFYNMGEFSVMQQKPALPERGGAGRDSGKTASEMGISHERCAAGEDAGEE